MGMFRQFPYSNFHEMNMDEIIKIVKNMLEEWARYHAEWDAWMNLMNDDWSNYQEVMNEAWQNMQDFINNYFDNIDVQNEINNKITSMVNSGELATIVSPYIPPQVTAWLNEHITEPTGVIIDTSLSVAGACADSKATGDAINIVQSELNTLIEVNATPENGYVNPTNGNIVGASLEEYKHINVNVFPNSKLLYRCGSNEDGAGYAFYDVNGTFINIGDNGTDSIEIITVPENAYTAKMSYLTANEEKFFAGIATTEEYKNLILANVYTRRTDFDTSDAVDDYYANINNGNIYNAPGYSYITVDVVEGAILYFTTANDETIAGAVFYDANGNYISGIAGTSTTQLITIPKYAKTAKLDYRTANINNFSAYQIIPQQLITDILSETASVDLSVLGDVYTRRTDFDTSDAIDDYYANINNGGVYSSPGFSYITVDVIAGAILHFTTANNESVAGAVFYDGYGNYISGIAGTSTTQLITIPKYAKIAKLDYRTENVNDFSAYQIIPQQLINDIISENASDDLNVIVDANGNGDYTSLLDALKNTPASANIRLKKGTYDLISEYEAEYGNTFFSNYAGYGGQTDPFYRGLWLTNGRRIVGDAGAEIRCVYTGSNTNVNEYFSVIANGGNVSLENIKITFGGVRYAIHDDFTNDSAESASVIKWKNIVFDGTPAKASVIGGGLGINIDYEIDGCVFFNNTKEWDINYHGSNSQNIDNVNIIKVTNCFGTKKCGIWDNGVATTISTMYVSNSKFLEIVKYRASTSTEENTALVAWCNETP